MKDLSGINYCDDATYATLRTLRRVFKFPQPGACSGYLGRYVRPSADHHKIYEPALPEILGYIHGRIRKPTFPAATEVTVTARGHSRVEAAITLGPKTHITGTGATDVFACIDLMMNLRPHGLGQKAEIVDLNEYARSRKVRRFGRK